MPADFVVELKTLRLVEPFRIAHGASSERHVLRLTAHKNGIEAVGEAPFVPYYPDRPGDSLAWLRELRDPLDANGLQRDGPRAAMLALELMRLDFMGKATGKPIGRLWQQLTGNHWPQPPPGCRSVDIPSDLDAFADKVRETVRQFRILKLKLGSGSIEQDELIVTRARSAAPAATIFVDVNGRWSVDEAAAMIPKLWKWSIRFVEQPISHRLGVEGWKELRARLPGSRMPLFADESAQTSDDVPRLAGVADGVNVKLLKCGGWHRAMEMILASRVHGLRVLLGSMVESSIGVTAAAQLAGLADWIDLDGHLFVANDDYDGLRYDGEGTLIVPDRPGIGVVRKPTGC